MGNMFDGVLERAGLDPIPPRTHKPKIPLDVFLNVNGDRLTSFQKEVIPLVFDPDAGPEEFSEAIHRINEKITELELAGWKPSRTGGDLVTRPEHYNMFPIEPTYFNMENGVDWCSGNFLKYVCRFPYKDGIQDLKKAMRYLAMFIRFLSNDGQWSK